MGPRRKVDAVKGWTVAVWVDVPDDWNAETVREEMRALLRKDTYEADDSDLILNAVHLPHADGIAARDVDPITNAISAARARGEWTPDESDA